MKSAMCLAFISACFRVISALLYHMWNSGHRRHAALVLEWSEMRELLQAFWFWHSRVHLGLSNKPGPQNSLEFATLLVDCGKCELKGFSKLTNCHSIHLSRIFSLCFFFNPRFQVICTTMHVGWPQRISGSQGVPSRMPRVFGFWIASEVETCRTLEQTFPVSVSETCRLREFVISFTGSEHFT